MTQEEAKKRGLSPLAKIISWAHVGVDPKIMGIAPVKATRLAVCSTMYCHNNVLIIQLKGYSSQLEIYTIYLHLYNILVVHSNCA